MLGRNIITHRHMQTPGQAGNAHIEGGRVDGNDHRGPPRGKFSFYTAQQLHPIVELPQWSKKHRGMVGGVGQQPTTRSSHLIAANAEKTGFWNLPAQSVNQSRAQDIAAVFRSRKKKSWGSNSILLKRPTGNATRN